MWVSQWQLEKIKRTEYYFKFVYGWRLRPCSGCNGSGYYDNSGSPKCGSCEGTGKERFRGPKAKELDNLT